MNVEESRGHEAVKDVAVINVPDEKWGEPTRAVVVVNEGHDAEEVSAEGIIDSESSASLTIPWCSGR